MESVTPILLIVLFVGVVVAMWTLGMGLDKSRITEYVHGRGGRIVSINWAPFGKGWFGEKNDRIYEVVYYDSTGNQHFATCKTSFWSGVYWTEDRITHRKSHWFETLSPSNEPGNPIIQQISDHGLRDELDEEERSDPRSSAASGGEASTRPSTAPTSRPLARRNTSWTSCAGCAEENERLRSEMEPASTKADARRLPFRARSIFRARNGKQELRTGAESCPTPAPETACPARAPGRGCVPEPPCRPGLPAPRRSSRRSCRISGSRMPRVVRAGVPMRMPDGSSGGRVSNGILFLLTVMPAASSASSATLPVTPREATSTSSR